MDNRRRDGAALSAFLQSEREGRAEKRALLKALETELAKDEENLDPLVAETLIEGLYEAEGLSPPRPGEEETAAFIAGIKGRAAAPEKTRFRFGRFFPGPLRWAAAAVFAAALLAFSANYITARVTGDCLVSRGAPRLCCGTKYCPCDHPAGREGALQ
ncbi:MAG: hypothetical protein LBQ61_10625 [Spirochaetales bacterium]|jgi:hypothetical protein|nr:hypothetical protein [Spirochaetales bacterium]